MNTEQEWITDRLPTMDDTAAGGFVIKPTTTRDAGWQAERYNYLKQGEPWAPYPKMPPPPNPEPRYWSKPSDIPDEVKFMRRKESSIFQIITSISNDGVSVATHDSTIRISWGSLCNFVWYPSNKSLDLSKGNECVCEES